MRILHIVPALGYGGVETYVIRLSRALVELGHEVAILTEGGPLEPLLEGSGVEVIRASLRQEGPDGICSRLEGKRFDILNAHNYLAGRIGHVVSLRIDTPYVLTVHGPRALAKRVLVRYWSRRVIALSEADKRGICGPFGLSPGRVRVSFYPVDVERYRPRAAAGETPAVPEEGGTSALRECGETSAPLIVHVSRFSNRKAKVALALLKALPTVVAKVPGARLLIVGTGPWFERIAAEATRLNEHLGPVAHVEGPRLELSDLFNAASVVVATATTAMEAMACGAPLIAAGRTGYAGLMDRANFARGLDLLFADHGRCPRPVSAGALREDLLRVLGDRDGCRAEAARLAGRMAAEFTPRRAAESVLAIYDDVLAGDVSCGDSRR